MDGRRSIRPCILVKDFSVETDVREVEAWIRDKGFNGVLKFKPDVYSA